MQNFRNADRTRHYSKRQCRTRSIRTGESNGGREDGEDGAEKLRVREKTEVDLEDILDSDEGEEQ